MESSKLTRDSCRSYIEKRLFEPRYNPKADTSTGGVGTIGVELEVFPNKLDTKASNVFLPVPLFGDENSLINILADTSKNFGGTAKYWDPGPKLAGYSSQIEKIEFPNGDCFLFEPGGQVEISIAPCSSIAELQSNLNAKQDILHAVTDASGIHFSQYGTNPWFNVNEIGNQLQKPRYRALEQYFNRIGPYGKQMMLQTCSLHINFDFGPDDSKLVKRFLAANLLVPFVTALFAHSPIIEGKVNGYKSYRTFLWQHLDPTRTGILPLQRIIKSLSKVDLVDTYLEFALSAPLIYISELGDQVIDKQYTFDYWMNHPIKGMLPELSNFENHLSLLFPEVRPKGYLEMRSVDVPPPEWQLVPVLFYAGLLYSDKHLDKALEWLLPKASQIEVLFEHATMGLTSEDIFTTSLKLMHIAMEGFSGLPDYFKEKHHAKQLESFFEKFILQRKTFADAWLKAYTVDNK